MLTSELLSLVMDSEEYVLESIDFALEELDTNGIRLTDESLEDLCIYLGENDWHDHKRNFELFQQGDGRYLCFLEGQWYMTAELLH